VRASGADPVAGGDRTRCEMTTKGLFIDEA
jgi:hypothetical protein